MQRTLLLNGSDAVSLQLGLTFSGYCSTMRSLDSTLCSVEKPRWMNHTENVSRFSPSGGMGRFLRTMVSWTTHFM